MTRSDWSIFFLLLLLSGAAAIVLGASPSAPTLPSSLFVASSGILVSVLVVLLIRQRREQYRQALRVAEIKSREAEMKHLWEAGLQVAAAEDYSQVLRAVVERARELLRGEASALCVWDEQKKWWVVQGASGATDAFEVSVKRLTPREGALPVDCPVVRFKYRQAHIDMPIVRGDQVIGCLCIANQQSRNFSLQERELLKGIADQAALAIDHARRLEGEGNRAAVTERDRLAREMHDTLAQLLGFVGFKSQAAREFLAQGQIDQATTQLDQLTALSQELYADTRELILGLKSDVNSRGLVAALGDYAQWFSELSGIQTTVEADGFEDVRFTPAVQVQLIRVVQEALSNIRKHARAKNGRIRFRRKDESALVTIEDDGQGFDPLHIPRGAWPRFGLQSMRERVESVGGEFTVESAQDKGTTITIQIPLVHRGGA